MAQTITVPSPMFTKRMHHAQEDFFYAFDAGRARFSMLNWHRRARKSTMAINLLIREAVSNPKSVYTYVAPTYKQAKAIIWRNPEMLFNYLPPKDAFHWKRNESEMFIEFENSTILQIKGADDPDSLRGIDSCGVVLDEWAMMKEEIWTEIFRPIIAQNKKRWALFIFTPKGQNHAYVMMNRAQANPEEWYVQTLDAVSSGLIPPDELAKAKAEMPPELFDQEFMCSFVTEEDRTLITSALLASLPTSLPFDDVRRIITIDPAIGGDECVMYLMQNTEIVAEKYINHRDTMKIVGEAMLFSNIYQTNDFIIDSNQLGKGICDRLVELGKDVYQFNSSESAVDKDRFLNKKIEAWWYVAEKMRNHEVVKPVDTELVRQLSSSPYKIRASSGKMQMEPKDKIKETLGRSPDRADAYVMGLYGLQFVEPSDAPVSAVGHYDPQYISMMSR